jgi:serine/threonine-protein kinase
MQPRPGGASRAVIVDFGVSRALSHGSEDEEMTGITRADMAVGTIEYMAPEQILNSRDVIAASDIYAVGAILYRAVMGRHIFGDLYDAELAKCKLMTDPPPLRTGRQDRVARGFEECVGKAIKRRPKERYDQADRILADLMILRDLVRVAALEFDETTHEVTGASIPIVITDPVSGITQPRISQPGPAPAPAPSRSSAPGPPPASGAARARAELEEPSVTRASGAPLQRTESSGSLTASEAFAPEPPQPRRGVPAVAAALLVVVALAGGAGLGSTWTQRKLAEGAALVQAAAAPAESAAAVPASAEPPATATAEPAAPPAEAIAAPTAEAAAPTTPTSAPAAAVAATTVAALGRPAGASTAPTGTRLQPRPPSTSTSTSAAPPSPATATTPASTWQPATAPTGAGTSTSAPKPAGAPKPTGAPKPSSAPTPPPIDSMDL